MPHVAGSRSLTLAPQEEIEFEFILSGDYPRYGQQPQRYLFSEPGEYKVQLAIWNITAERTVESNPTRVQVVLPESDADRAALKDLLALDSWWRIYAPWLGPPVNLQEFRERHAGSRYVKFTELPLLYARFNRPSTERDPHEIVAIYDECSALIERAEAEEWSKGWIAVARTLRLSMNIRAQMYAHQIGRKIEGLQPADPPSSNPPPPD